MVTLVGVCLWEHFEVETLISRQETEQQKERVVSFIFDVKLVWIPNSHQGIHDRAFWRTCCQPSVLCLSVGCTVDTHHMFVCTLCSCAFVC